MEIESFLEVVIAVIVIVGSVISTSSKARRRRVAEAARQSASPVKAKPSAAHQHHPYAQPGVMPPMAFGDIPGQVITPTVHPHVQPDCVTHDAPGSLGFTSSEGKDPCHEDQLTHPRSEAAPVQEQPGLTFDWSGENMVKAFVMQEVLTRPAHRSR